MVFAHAYFRNKRQSNLCPRSKNKASLLQYRTVITWRFGINAAYEAVPWLRRLLAGLSPRRPEFGYGSVRAGIFFGQSGTGTGFSPCQFHSICAPLLEKTNHFHNYQGCGASVTSTTGFFTIKKGPTVTNSVRLLQGTEFVSKEIVTIQVTAGSDIKSSARGR